MNQVIRHAFQYLLLQLQVILLQKQVVIYLSTQQTGALTATSFVGSGANLTDVDAGATGGGSDRIFFENGVTVTTNYTIGTTFGATANALSAGPITINAGVTVTVPSGSVYSVV